MNVGALGPARRAGHRRRLQGVPAAGRHHLRRHRHQPGQRPRDRHPGRLLRPSPADADPAPGAAARPHGGRPRARDGPHHPRAGPRLRHRRALRDRRRSACSSSSSWRGLWGLVFTGFPYAIALKTGNPGAVASSFILFFPFAFLTTSFLPKDALSGWLAAVATRQPGDLPPRRAALAHHRRVGRRPASAPPSLAVVGVGVVSMSPRPGHAAGPGQAGLTPVGADVRRGCGAVPRWPASLRSNSAVTWS